MQIRLRPKTFEAVAIGIIVMGWLWLTAVYAFTAYAVFFLDRSGWWFLLAMMITSRSNLKVTKG